MPLDVVALVLLAAVLHASWNALLKPVDERDMFDYTPLIEANGEVVVTYERLEVFALGGFVVG